MAGTLYVVGTPIGNLGDLTDRARDTLARVEVIAAEDTRRTGRLLHGLGIGVGVERRAAPRLVSFFVGNESRRVPELVTLLDEGSDVALVTDAGMPSVSDPGYRLVAACVEAGIAVDVIPGPSAALAALVISGLPSDRFVFEGFLPRSGRARKERIASLVAEPRTVVLFESPRRLAATLSHLHRSLGDRRAVVARELTKLHQEILRGTLESLAQDVAERDLRGEITLVIEGTSARAEDQLRSSVEDAASLAREDMKSGAKPRDAARRAARATGYSTGEVYAAVVGASGSASATATQLAPSSSGDGATGSSSAAAPAPASGEGRRGSRTPRSSHQPSPAEGGGAGR